MSTTTENLGLNLPEKTENFDLGVFNDNFQAIDDYAGEGSEIPDGSIDLSKLSATAQAAINDKTPANGSVTWAKLNSAVQNTINSKADVESGTITSDNQAWYSSDTSKKMTGSYQLIGDYCFLSATAQRIDGWGTVYYSLPVAAVASGSAAAVNDTNYTINTATQNNISVLEIMRADRQTMSDGSLYFTLIYKYK